MKIIHIIPTLNKGGAERLVLDICIELHQQGHEVYLVTFSNENTYEFLSNKVNHKVIPSTFVPSLSGKSKVVVDELQEFIDEIKPDIIHSHLFESEIVLSQTKETGAKYFFHLHDNVPQLKRLTLSTFLSKKGMTNYYERRIVLKKIIARKTTIIAIADDSFNFAKENLPKQIAIHKMDNAINFNRFTSKNVNRNENDLVMVGSFVPKKNHQLAINVVAELQTLGISTRLHLLGDGPLRSILEEMSQDLGLKDNILFHGNVDYPEEYFNSSSIYLHTAKYEPFGLVLLEAMASGLPVICTDGKGNSHLIVEGKNGFLAKTHSSHELANLVAKLLSEPDKLVQMRKDSRDFAKQFDIHPYCERLLQLYRN